MQYANEPVNEVKAVIMEMDLIIQTAIIHKTAWKQTLIGLPGNMPNEILRLFDELYEKYLDGQPMYHGLEKLLQAKEINLPFGNINDSPGEKTVCALGNLKQKNFNRLLNEPEVKTFSDAAKQIYNWKKLGIKTAIISADENFDEVLDTKDIRTLFDVKINGQKSRQKGLKEKPEADIYMQAVKELHVSPESCILLDDSVAGLQAGSKANFGLLVGVNRYGNRKILSENGADLVIDSFEELDLLNDPEIKGWFTQNIPPFASEYVKIGDEVYGKTPVLFLDYDGTLTPIVKHPEDAVISQEMQEVLKECASKFRVAAVSGRDMNDLRNKVNLPNLIYAGSHGFHISGPDGLYMEHEKSDEILPRLDELEKKLQKEFSHIKRAQIDRKRYAIAVHYRNVNKEDVPFMLEKLNEIIANFPDLKKGKGKKIVELKPNIEWNKGKAVKWILEKLNLTDKNKYIPIYIGDDVTDEDAYKVLKDWGMGIQVGPGATNSAARYRLRNVYQVRMLLKDLANFMV
jgi:trehalose 6-phosphate phosphatase